MVAPTYQELSADQVLGFGDDPGNGMTMTCQRSKQSQNCWIFLSHVNDFESWKCCKHHKRFTGEYSADLVTLRMAGPKSRRRQRCVRPSGGWHRVGHLLSCPDYNSHLLPRYCDNDGIYSTLDISSPPCSITPTWVWRDNNNCLLFRLQNHTWWQARPRYTWRLDRFCLHSPGTGDISHLPRSPDMDTFYLYLFHG